MLLPTASLPPSSAAATVWNWRRDQLFFFNWYFYPEESIHICWRSVNLQLWSKPLWPCIMWKLLLSCKKYILTQRQNACIINLFLLFILIFFIQEGNLMKQFAFVYFSNTLYIDCVFQRFAPSLRSNTKYLCNFKLHLSSFFFRL